MTDQPSAPAGWYSNSVEGKQQWWDGENWGSQTRPAPVQSFEARRSYWTGWSRSASLAVGIVFAVLSLPLGLIALFFVVSLSIGSIPTVVIWLICVAIAVLMFVNYYVRGKQLDAMTPQQPPTQN